VAGPEAENAARETPSQKAAATSARSWTRALIGSVVGLVSAAGLLGTVISTYFQGRSWDYQNGAVRIEKDAAAVVGALDSLNKIIDEKWISTYEMDDAIKTRKDGDKLKAAVDRFYAANKDWERQHQGLASRLQLDVDSQFGVDGAKAAAGLNSDCTAYALGSQQPQGSEPLSVRALLEIAYDCHNIIKGKIDEQLQARDANNAQWPATTVEPDPGRLRLSHVWWVNKVLQCLMLDRALELRHRSPQVPILPSQMPFLSLTGGADAHGYEISEREQARESQCVDAYKTNPELGMAAVKQH
jgi:hypothetical protein